MSKNQWIRIAMAICAVLVVVAVAANVRGLFGGSLFGYANAEKYTAGEAEISGPVRNLDIEWVNGKVNLQYHSEQTVELREASDKPIGEDLKLRWWLDGDTLRVQYAKNGFRFGWNQEKELTVVLPESIAFDTVHISAASGDLNLSGLKTETLDLNVTSGDIQADAEAKKVSANATSGSVTLEIAGEVADIAAGTTSGIIQVKAGSAESLKATSTSGSIRITADQAGKCEAVATSGTVSASLGEAEHVELSTTSGKVTVSIAKLSELKINSTSGSIIAGLPEEPGFTAAIETVSGSVHSDLPLSQSGDRYTCGDGSARVEIESTSGDIQLNKAE